MGGIKSSPTIAGKRREAPARGGIGTLNLVRNPPIFRIRGSACELVFRELLL